MICRMKVGVYRQQDAHPLPERVKTRHNLGYTFKVHGNPRAWLLLCCRGGWEAGYASYLKDMT